MEDPGRKWGRIEVLGLVAVITIGLGHLVMGIGAYGLWDPPAEWKGSITRRDITRKEEKPGARKAVTTERVTEIDLAESARRELEERKKGEAGDEKETGETAGEKKEKNTGGEGTLGPPMQGWMIRTGLRVFGVHDWAARLPFALAGLLVTVLVYLLGTWMFGWFAGLVSAFVLLGFPGFLFDARLLTSNMDATLALTLAVGGFALFFWERSGKVVRTTGALAATAGMVMGYFAAGAVLGVLLPCLVALTAVAAVFLSKRQDMERKTRWVYIFSMGLLAAVVVGLTIQTQVEIRDPQGYSSFLGATPRHATTVASYEGITTPPSRPVMFDALVRHVAYSTFPWVGLLPIALVLGVGFLRGRSISKVKDKEADPEAKGEKEEEISEGRESEKEAPTSENGLRFYGGVWLATWAAFTMLLCTYWVVRFADIKFLGLPALALACGVTTIGLGRSNSQRRTAALVTALFIIAIVIRDFVGFPQALIQSGINYNIIHPETVSMRRPIVLFGFLFIASLMVLMILRPKEKILQWPESLPEWLCASDIWKQMEKLRSWRWLKGRRLILGAPAAFLSGFGLSLFSFVVLLMYWILETILYPLWLLDNIEKGERFRPSALLFPGDDLKWFGELAGRVVLEKNAVGKGKFIDKAGAVFRLSYWGIVVALVAVVWSLRLLARCMFLIFVGLPFYVAARLLRMLIPYLSRFFVSVEKARSKEKAGEKDDKAQKKKPGKKSDKVAPGQFAEVRHWAVMLPCLVALSFTYWSGHRLLKSLSPHFSHRAVFERFVEARGDEEDVPLAVYKMESRSADFYNAGAMISETELIKRYPHGRPRVDPLVAYLAEPQRVFALTDVSHLGSLDTDARRAGVKYHVLDADSQWFLLLSNELGPGETDMNPLLEIVSDTPPKNVGRRIGAVFKEPASKAEEGDLELLGVEMPAEVYKGHEFPVTLHFAVRSDIRGQWKIFIHFDGPGPRFFGDHDPVDGKYGTRHWTKGTYITDPYVVPAHHTSRVSTPSGVYRVWMGFFRGDTRMTVMEGPKDNANRVDLGTVRVRNKPLASCR